MQQSLEEILREKMAVPVSIKGKEGATVMPMEAIAMAIMNNAMRGDLAQRLTDTEQPNFRRPYEKSKPGEKPNDRIVYTIFTGGTYIDMNVIEKKEN